MESKFTQKYSTIIIVALVAGIMGSLATSLLDSSSEGGMRIRETAPGWQKIWGNLEIEGHTNITGRLKAAQMKADKINGTGMTLQGKAKAAEVEADKVTGKGLEIAGKTTSEGIDVGAEGLTVQGSSTITDLTVTQLNIRDMNVYQEIEMMKRKAAPKELMAEEQLKLISGPSVFVISGSSDILSITPYTIDGRIIHLLFLENAIGIGVFDSTPEGTTGTGEPGGAPYQQNLVLSDNLTYENGDSLTLVCYDNNWYEISRSTN